MSMMYVANRSVCLFSSLNDDVFSSGQVGAYVHGASTCRTWTLARVILASRYEE